MDIVIILKSIFLGIVEGLTEFIPVSSTAHLIVASKLADFSYVQNGVFEVVIQLGAIMAICLLYREKLFNTAVGFFQNKSSRKFTYNIALAFFPSVFFGIFFYSIIKRLFFSLDYIAFALILGGIAIIFIEKANIKPSHHEIENLPKSKALFIGLFQTIAMIPGVSRSGATIMGSLLLKLDRKTATEFSFFLAIPTIIGASIFDIYKNINVLNTSSIEIILVGFLASFIASLLVIKWLIHYVSNHNFLLFAYYRIILGLLILFIIS